MNKINFAKSYARARPSECWLKGAYTTGYSLPSGHAQNSFVFYWWIGAKIRAWLVCISSLVLIMLVVLSRVYLGLHWLGDAFVGWAVGFALLIVFWRLEEPLTTVVSKHNPNKFYVVLVLTNLSSTILTWLW
jgi:membrane-associated phospholipid phosphatase